MWQLVLQALWILIPGGIANMAPVFAARLFPQFSKPVDMGRKLGGKRIFGDHKTFRGFLAGMITGEATFQTQRALIKVFPEMTALGLLDSAQSVFPLWGAYLGLGALTGDLLKSFIKRQISIPPGRSWFPWDQIDWILGTLAFAVVFVQISYSIVGASIALGLVLHLIVKWIGYLLGINKTRI